MAAVINRGQRAGTAVVPAPVGGLNARDSVAAMAPTDAETLVNMMPFGDRVETRAGFDDEATMGSDATTLSGDTEGLRAMFKYPSAANGDIYFVLYYWSENVAGTQRRRGTICTLSGGVLTRVLQLAATGSTNSFASISTPVLFTDAAGNQHLIFVSTHITAGFSLVATVRDYSGSWGTLAITGVDSTTTKAVSHQKRLWFLTGGIPGYLAVGATTGTITNFDVRAFMTRGGEVIDIQTWTVDGGIGGMDDKLMFLTSAGQMIVYEGTDPTSIATWRLVGVFDIGTAASQSAGAYGKQDNFTMGYGGDVLLLLNDGLTSAERVLRPQTLPTGPDYTISAKIRKLLATAASAYPSTNAAVGWKLIHLPTLRQLMVVIPTARVTVTSSPIAVYTWTTDVYVMSTETGAWTKFTGLNILDAVTTPTGMYFIDGGMTVYKYDGSHTSDNGTAISYEVRQAYNYLQTPGKKQITLVEANLKATGNFSLAIAVDADFNGGTLSTYTSYTVTGTQYLVPQPSANQYGSALALHMKGQTSAGVVSWFSTRWFAKQAKGF